MRFLEAEPDLEIIGRATRGDQALEAVDRFDPDVALLDVRMPGLTGIEVARRLTEQRSRTQVLLYTAEADRSRLLEGLDVGARGFVLKDAPLDDLARAIRLVAAGSTYVDPGLAGFLRASGVAERAPSLTPREREVLRLIANGMRNEQIAQELFISPFTVRTHVKKAMDKLEADTRTQAVANAMRQSLIT